MQAYVIPFQSLGLNDISEVGGKNASLGEMIANLSSSGVQVPGGFATTAQAYRDFLAHGGLGKRIEALLEKLNVEDVTALAEAGRMIRSWIVDAPLPDRLEQEVRAHYAMLAGESDASFAVRSSATAEDLPDASFAGQQETFLNIHGIDNILHAIREVFASLYNDRAISYRVHKDFTHADVALSAGIQRMVRSDLGASGVMFTLDTESGFRDAVFITSSYGLGEMVVQGAVNPDEFYVHKPQLAAGFPAIIRRTLGSKQLRMVFDEQRSAGRSTKIESIPAVDQTRFSLTDEDVLLLARYAMSIEQHYGRAMDIEWGKDGLDGHLYILQARPETVKSNAGNGGTEKYQLQQRGDVLVEGRAIGQKIGCGRVRIILSADEMSKVQAGDVLVTDMTDPNWEPVMKKASAIITNRGGRTCHAAIIARELGIPAIVGCGHATSALREGEIVTASCAEGDTGYVYHGRLPFDVVVHSETLLPPLPVKLMLNVGNPNLAFEFAHLPSAGVGLARLEFIINNLIGIHPKAVLEYNKLPGKLREAVLLRSAGYADPEEFYVEKITEGVATLAAAFWPKPVIVRLSDFKSNEYRKLLGGEIYEPMEENPMIGFRGAGRYVAPNFSDCFELECRAMKRVREKLGYTNVELMVPFVRTVQEAREVVASMASHGLTRGEHGLRLIMMCEIPSNALLAEAFLEYFDGFSIGSNDLTQLTLGLDRDSALVADRFDERDEAVKMLLKMAITTCNRLNKYVGICGQGPSDHFDFAQWLVETGIQTLSLNPDTLLETWRRLGAVEK
ncbi:phosphoenolpyruvate synthase [Gallionella capsiferriformans]|uniref:Phosphoenolpyruvate synthase n=1 Tax=Gallionella capsiferriformans (strain ES-2) TaxID=395494 RepID=D9SCI1_GALCS|nr:phosphoenolpyruvate synthase [Gallionella capsiferriformans]ADL56562.1 phosphoenolpyruvate synthase [Gallionella capsiferriformans ES-2]